MVWHPVTFATGVDFNTHRLLRAIHHNTLLSKLSENQQASPDEIMVSEVTLRDAFTDYPELLRTTDQILNNCSISFQLGTDKNLKYAKGSAQADWDILVARPGTALEPL